MPGPWYSGNLIVSTSVFFSASAALSPLIFAGFGARVRQPLAGQMLLSTRLLATIDVDELPDDYGVDVALTMSALDRGLPTGIWRLRTGS